MNIFNKLDSTFTLTHFKNNSDLILGNLMKILNGNEENFMFRIGNNRIYKGIVHKQGLY